VKRPSALLARDPRRSLYELLPAARAAKSGLPLASVFDPCAAARFPELREAVRTLVTGAGTALTDFSSEGKCCGYGGHMRLANPRSTTGSWRTGRLLRGALCRLLHELPRDLPRGAEGGRARSGPLFRPLDGDTTLEEKRQNAVALKRELMEMENMVILPFRHSPGMI
jgi:hypothetical protein